MRVFFEDWTPLIRVPVVDNALVDLSAATIDLPDELMSEWNLCLNDLASLRARLAVYDPESA